MRAGGTPEPERIRSGGESPPLCFREVKLKFSKGTIDWNIWKPPEKKRCAKRKRCSRCCGTGEMVVFYYGKRTLEPCDGGPQGRCSVRCKN